MTEDEKYMKEALAEARKALQRDEIPIGAVVVANGRIIGRGHNLTETLHDVTAHAEMQAITAAAETINGKYLDKCALYVTVEPCVMCAGAIGWSQLGKLVFGATDEKRGYQKLAPAALHPKCQVVSGVLSDECAQLMKDFAEPIFSFFYPHDYGIFHYSSIIFHFLGVSSNSTYSPSSSLIIFPCPAPEALRVLCPLRL